MNRDIIITFGRNSILTYDTANELQSWETLQYADLARYLNTAPAIIGFGIQYKLETLARFGLNGARAKAVTIDLRQQSHSITALLFANNVVYQNLTTTKAIMDALIGLVNIAKANGVLYLTQETYITFPPPKEVIYV